MQKLKFIKLQYDGHKLSVVAKTCVNLKHTRQVLGQALYSIRFPLVDGNTFCREIANQNVLTPEETNDILIHYVAKKPPTRKCFKSEHRQQTNLARVIRFQDVSPSDFMSMFCTTDPEVLTFRVIHSAYIKGILMYGSHSGDCRYSYTLQLYKEFDEYNTCSLASVVVEIETNENIKNV